MTLKKAKSLGCSAQSIPTGHMNTHAFPFLLFLTAVKVFKQIILVVEEADGHIPPSTREVMVCHPFEPGQW